MHERIMRWFGKFVVVFFLVEVGLSLLANLVRRVTTGEWLIALCVLNTFAYFIRERRRPRDRKPRSTSGGERTPVMPRRNV
jgi:hypothetical protein